jgi:glucose-6-phosphate 1-dehydrogenase
MIPTSTSIVIFGASGDLTARKLIPSLYNIVRKKRFAGPIDIIGFSRTPFSDDAFRDKMKEAVFAFAPDSYEDSEWRDFATHLFYRPGSIDRIEDYEALKSFTNPTIDGPRNCLYYLATDPGFYPTAIGCLSQSNMIAEDTSGSYRRIIIEKPFGRDLASAIALNHRLHEVLREQQVYRIDHYLGKETVQNLLVFRFGNAIFEPLWNRNYIDHVQITVAESVGVEHRASYYEKAGVLRDMFQNHLLQLLTLVAMEPPVVFEADALRNEKVKVLSALRDIAPEHSARRTVRAQYEGYTSESGVRADSTTETYAALRLQIDNWRWQGVPFYLRSGKMMKDKSSEIVIQFRRPPTQILDVSAGRTELFTNRLSMIIQPDEGIHLRFITKVPEGGLRTRPADMDFHFRDSFGGNVLPDAYERLLLDALHGDASLFTRSDEIELAWKFIDGVRSGWESEYAPPMLRYEKGSWGPREGDELLGREGRWWVHDAGIHDTPDN